MRKEKGWLTFKEWQEEIGHRRNETLIAIRILANALLSDEDLSQCHIGQQLVEIGRAITECGLTDEMICQAINEVRREMVKPENEDEDEDSQRFSNVLTYVDPKYHKMDNSPELRAMRSKHASHVVGGHALAKKLAEA
jgi:iron-sulfur cluster repair protein YtfE (RIC family)